MNEAKNIIISGTGVDSVYLCEIRDAGNAVFRAYFRHDGSINFLDAEECLFEQRHNVWPADNSVTSFRSLIDYGQCAERVMKAREIRIYVPSNPANTDFCVSVQTKIGGRYSQLFGGLFSECSSHASDRIERNGDAYMEYVRFLIPVPEFDSGSDNLVVGDFVRVSMSPITDLVNGDYVMSAVLDPGHAVFPENLRFRFGATFRNDDDGLPGISVMTHGTVPFDRPGDIVLELSGDPAFGEGKTIYSERIDIVPDPDGEEGWKFFIPLYVSEADGRFRFIIQDIEDISQKGFGTYEMTWENVPRTLAARIKVDTDKGQFVSNTVPIDKDTLKYVLGKSSVNTSVAAMYPESWNEYKDKYMLNINIVNEIAGDGPSRPTATGQVSSPLIYKPVFFKVSEAETINLVSGLSQRIGLDLREYETKVSLFRIAVGERRFIETERTSAYVIFKIDASQLSGDETRYHLLDQDSNYITSGRLTFS